MSAGQESQKGVSIRCFEEGVMLYLSDNRSIAIDYDDYSVLCDLILEQERRQRRPKAKPVPATPLTIACTCGRIDTHPPCGGEFDQHPNMPSEYCRHYHKGGTICGHPRRCHMAAKE